MVMMMCAINVFCLGKEKGGSARVRIGEGDERDLFIMRAAKLEVAGPSCGGSPRSSMARAGRILFIVF